MVRGFDAGVHLGDVAVRINDECITRGEFLALVIHHRAVLGRDFRVGISEQFEIEPFFRAKVFVRLCGIDAHSENDYASIAVLCEIALKIARLHGATAGEIFRVEIKDDPFASVILQAHLRTVTGCETEIRRGLSDLRLCLRFRCRHAGERRKADGR